MDLYEVFSSPFILYEANSFNNPGKMLKAKFKTKNIEGSTTAEEVFILSKKHFDDIVTQYKNYYFDNVQAKESSYRLYIGMVKDYEFNEYNIYSIDYDNIKDKISNENKYYSNFEVEVILISILKYQLVGGRIIILKKKTIPKMMNQQEKQSQNQSVSFALKKTPNILYLECLHVCVCNVCDGKGRFNKCPLCRTKTKNQKIILT